MNNQSTDNNSSTNKLIKLVEYIDNHIIYYQIKYGDITRKLDINLKNGLEYYLVIDMRYMHSRVQIKEINTGKSKDYPLLTVAKHIQGDATYSDLFFNTLNKVLDEK